MKFNYKFPLNELAIKPPKLRFCLAKYKFYAGQIDPDVFEVLEKSDNKEVEKWLAQGKMSEAKKLARKYGVFRK